MKNFEGSPSVVFLDGTYKLNLENYCLYAAVVQDRTGRGRPVALSFLSSETVENITQLFDAFKMCHKSWEDIGVVFVDKDQKVIKAIKSSFKASKVLLCTWHVLAYLRKHMARTFGAAKAQAYLHFYDCLVARTEHDFDESWTKLIDSVPNKTTQSYLEENWHKCREMWAMYARRQLRLFGANTNNFVDAFLRVVKAAVHIVRRRRPHLNASILSWTTRVSL